jgi:tetratricopeptide (TPR) repeat protein
MKKLLLIITLLTCITGHLYANDLQTAQEYYDRDDITNAINAINAAVKVKYADNAEAWMLMYKIYKKAQYTSPYSSFPDDCISNQHRAIRKLMELSDGKTWLQQEFGHEYRQLFNKFYSEFVTYANSSMKNKSFGNALKNYKNALQVYDDIYKYGLDPSPVDTAVIFRAGYCALQNEKYAETESFFKKLADIPVKNKQYAMLYAWLSKYYMLETKDLPKAKAMFDKGLALFPDDKDLKELISYFNSGAGQ